MSKLLEKATATPSIHQAARFEQFNLAENPFPSEPAVNPRSEDKRINGQIYAMEIRRAEYDQIINNFLRVPQTDKNHLRLGFIADRSYIGRGNGKSAFLIHLQQKINARYCLDISDKANKCFSIVVNPEAGGRTKTFPKFVDALFQSILNTGIIEECLAGIRIDAVLSTMPQVAQSLGEMSDSELVSNFNDKRWFEEQGFDLVKARQAIAANPHVVELTGSFPLVRELATLAPVMVTRDDFQSYYREELKKPKEKLEFLFSDLVKFFLAAGFNGCYVLVDDFERITDLQSASQKKDFALELRSCLYDGMFLSAKYGFYNLFLVLHAGVPGLIHEAWAASGMENRAPLDLTPANHIVVFDKLSQEHAKVLLVSYLQEYRLTSAASALHPFTARAVLRMGERTEYNATKLLKLAYEALDKAANEESIGEIDEEFVDSIASRADLDARARKGAPGIESQEAIDLTKKITESGE